MANTVIFRPDGPGSIHDDPGLTGPSSIVGAATIWQALSDALDTSYVHMAGGSNLTTGFALAFPDVVVSPTQRVARVRMGWRVKRSGTPNAHQVEGTIAKKLVPGTTRSWYAKFLFSANPVLPANVYSPWYKPSEVITDDGPAPTGEWWQPSDLQDLETDEWSWPGGTGTNYSHFIYENWIEAEVVEPPAAAWDNTTLGQDKGRNPTLRWIWSGNGENQRARSVKVFTKAQTLVGGFDPDVDTPVYQVLEQVSSSDQMTLIHGVGGGGFTTPDLALQYNTEYVPFLKVAKRINTEDWWTPDWIVGQAFKTTAIPSATSLSPSGTIDTNKPILSWTFNHNNASGSADQAERDVRLYEEPVGGWPGSGVPGDPVWDGAVGDPLVHSQGASTSKTVSLETLGVSLDNNTDFRLYVRVAKADPEAPSVMVWSNFATSDFLTDFEEPPTPTINAYADPAKPVDVIVDVTATPPGVGQPDTDYYNLYRSIDGGPYEEFHIGGGQTSTNIPGPASFQVRDPEVPLHKVISYQVEAVTTDIGIPVASPMVSDSVTLDTNQVWLKAPLNPAMDLRLLTEDKWLALVNVRQRTLHAPLGRAKPVVVRGEHSYKNMALTTVILGDATYEGLFELLDSDYTMFLQTPKGSWYVELNGELTELAHLWDQLRNEEDVWRITIPFVEVSSDV